MRVGRQRHGLALSNKRIVGGWQAPYSDIWEHDYQKGIIYTYGSKNASVQDLNSGVFDGLKTWIPVEGAALFSSNNAAYLGGASDSNHTFFGRNELLRRGPSGQPHEHPGRLGSRFGRLRRGSHQDRRRVERLKPLELGPDDIIQVGEKVIVIGYPAVSAQTYAVTPTQQSGVTNLRADFVLEPATLEGVIARLTSTPDRSDDMLELDANSIGEGFRWWAGA